MHLNTDLTGLFGITLAIFALLVRVPRVQAFPVRQRAAVLAAAIVLVTIPLWGLSLSGFVRGITGDLSITTLALLALALMRSLSGYVLVGDANRLRMLRAIAIAAVVFYPLALGFTEFDPYRLGYGNLWFIVLSVGAGGLVRPALLRVLCAVHRAGGRGLECGLVRISQCLGLFAGSVAGDLRDRRAGEILVGAKEKNECLV